MLQEREREKLMDRKSIRQEEPNKERERERVDDHKKNKEMRYKILKNIHKIIQKGEREREGKRESGRER